MHIVNSNAEKSALLEVIDLGARLADNPHDTALRGVYRRRQALLRQHARAGAQQHRMTTNPSPRQFMIDPRGLASFLAGATP